MRRQGKERGQSFGIKLWQYTYIAKLTNECGSSQGAVTEFVCPPRAIFPLTRRKKASQSVACAVKNATERYRIILIWRAMMREVLSSSSRRDRQCVDSLIFEEYLRFSCSYKEWSFDVESLFWKKKVRLACASSVPASRWIFYW